MKSIPYITVNQMSEVDRLMIEEYQIELMQMMENAGRNLAQLARNRFLSGNVKEHTIVVLAGSGGNGGGGMVCARHLHNWGADVVLITQRVPHEYLGVPLHQLKILQKMQVPIISGIDFLASNNDIAPTLVIDALIGYSLTGEPYGISAELIAWANHMDAYILSLDVPSGLDSDSGKIHQHTIQATATMTLALPKTGLSKPIGDDRIGELFLADISVPKNLYHSMGINFDYGSVFPQHQIIQIR